ncbi:MFS transporter [Antrihabitans sp. YC3-6]|uniref:MFS transporter n=1 Tax=Antrihabitans stalagmiti TaxID=2799499 RepID=A0A934U1C6_9NOCA|nr:MFS transporter [Antrihabitans stalagmiti]MBJ8338086.1 MFS transporter [Antrihabitans stalagmiti]
MNQVEPRRRGAIAVVLVAVFVSSLDVMIVNIAFPDMLLSFSDATLGDLSWVLSAYAITFAALLMPAGRWADRSGRKRAFLVGLVVFTLASAACAAAPMLEVLVAGRVAQGVGAALMTPSSLGLLLALFPAEKRGAAIGLWSAMSGAGAAFGPPIGGLLVQADWRWVFLVNLPIGVAAVIVGIRTLPEMREERPTAPDVLGAVVLAATAAAIVAAIVQGPDWGWTSGGVVGLFALGIVGVVFSVRRTFRHPAPVIDPAILRIRSVAVGDLATFFLFGSFAALILASTLFLTGIWHHSVLRAAMEIAPGPLMVAVAAVPGGILAERYGARLVGLVGSVLFAAAGVWWVLATEVAPAYTTTFLPALLVGGVGLGLLLTSVASAATLSLPPERFATGSALMTMCRQVGVAIGVAVVAVILDVRPDLAAFHTAWLFMAGCSLAAGLTLLMLGAERSSDTVEAAQVAAATN